MTNTYIEILEIILFIFMLPVVFKTLEIIDFDKIFRKTHLSKKQLFYVILTICFSYTFTKSISMILLNILNIINR